MKKFTEYQQINNLMHHDHWYLRKLAFIVGRKNGLKDQWIDGATKNKDKRQVARFVVLWQPVYFNSDANGVSEDAFR